MWEKVAKGINTKETLMTAWLLECYLCLFGSIFNNSHPVWTNKSRFQKMQERTGENLNYQYVDYSAHLHGNFSITYISIVLNPSVQQHNHVLHTTLLLWVSLSNRKLFSLTFIHEDFASPFCPHVKLLLTQPFPKIFHNKSTPGKGRDYVSQPLEGF